MDSKTALSPLTRRLSLISPLSAEDETAVLALPHTLRSLENAQYVVREGDRATLSCLVLDGFAIRHKVTSEGGRQILNVHMAGDMVDLQNSLLEVADHNVQALSKLKAAFIPREAIIELAFERPAVGKALWLETLVEGSIAREWIVNVGRRSALQRIAHLLCEFAYRLGAVGLDQACEYELPMTQEQIADTVGLTPVHVNRTLKEIDRLGLTRRTKKSIAITDLAKLARYADFRSTYLHLPQRALPPHLQGQCG
ncbi:MAG: Crp/Fnr family transcriptional regulator [Novosphingobium sp.]